MILEIDNIAIKRRCKTLFKGLGFCLAGGSCLVIKGANGSGKTTLLKIIAGLIKPNAGSVKLNQINIAQNYHQYSSQIQYIGHKKIIKPHFSVLDHLKLYCAFGGDKILIPAVISHFKLENIIDIKAEQLSEGWQKKLSLCKLLCCPAKIWLLDEPTINLDKNSIIQLIDLIETRTSDGGIVIIVTHNELLCEIGNNLNIEDFSQKEIS